MRMVDGMVTSRTEVAYYSTAPSRRPKRRPAAGTRCCRRFFQDGTIPWTKKFSKHQQKIIKNYYDNRESISLQRLSELVTELYLAEGKGREKQWKYIVGALQKAGDSRPTGSSICGRKTIRHCWRSWSKS